MELKPKYYMNRKSSDWKSCNGITIMDTDLKLTVFGLTEIPGLGSIYSLAFDEFKYGYEFTPRWDSVNGWTVTFLDAVVNKAKLHATVEYYENNEVPCTMPTFYKAAHKMFK